MSYTRGCCCNKETTGITSDCENATNCSNIGWIIRESPPFGAAYDSLASLCDLPPSWIPPYYWYTGYMTLQICCDNCGQLGACCIRNDDSTCECVENATRCDCIDIGGVWDASNNCTTTCRGKCYVFFEGGSQIVVPNLTYCECRDYPNKIFSQWDSNPVDTGGLVGECNNGKGDWVTIESWTTVNGGPEHFFQDYKSYCLDCPGGGTGATGATCGACDLFRP